MARIIGRRRTVKKAPETAAPEEPLHVESITWGDLTWINIQPPTPREIEYLAQNYPFHPLDLDDCLSRIQRPTIRRLGWPPSASGRRSSATST